MGESFVIDDLLDFPSDDDPLPIPLGSSFHSLPADSTNSSSLTSAVISSSASHSNVAAASASNTTSLHHPHLPGDLCVPVPEDDMAELEWLSNVAEESFSSEDLQKLQLISGIKVEPSETHDHSIVVSSNNNNPIFDSEVSVPGKARSKRPRVTPGNWTTRLLHVSHSPSPSPSPSPSISSASSSSDPDAVFHSTAGKKRPAPRRKDIGGEDRRCLHCATNTTPQWRTGPMGPKTLCNACGVRYKSGRLVPEYRPAASPTFVLTKHSNSHRKVMELRRQKEIMQHHQHHHFLQHPNLMFDFHVSNGDDYLIHQHLGHDFRQLI